MQRKFHYNKHIHFLKNNEGNLFFFELFVFIVKDTKNIKDNMFDKIRSSIKSSIKVSRVQLMLITLQVRINFGFSISFFLLFPIFSLFVLIHKRLNFGKIWIGSAVPQTFFVFVDLT